MRFLPILLLCLSISIPAHAVAVRSGYGWIREAPPAAKVLAGFVELHNTSGAEVVVTGGSSPDFDRVEIHETSMKEGEMKMRPIKRLVIKDDEWLLFQPGGIHLMLIGPHRELHIGDKVNVQLDAENKGLINLQLEVMTEAPSRAP